MAAPIAAIAAARERRVIEAFTVAGATGPASARALETLGLDPTDLGMRRLRSQAVIREAGPGVFYLDVEVWEAVRRMRRRIIILALILAVAVVLSILVVGQRTAG